MTQKDIKQLELELWEAADELRANLKLTANEYKDPSLSTAKNLFLASTMSTLNMDWSLRNHISEHFVWIRIKGIVVGNLTFNPLNR